MTGSQTDTPAIDAPTVPLPPLPQRPPPPARPSGRHRRTRADALAAEGQADFDATFVPPTAPRTIGVRY